MFNMCQIILVWCFLLISLSVWSFLLDDLPPTARCVMLLPGSSEFLLLVLSGFDTHVLKLHTGLALLFFPDGLAPFSLRKGGFSLVTFLP